MKLHEYACMYLRFAHENMYSHHALVMIGMILWSKYAYSIPETKVCFSHSKAFLQLSIHLGMHLINIISFSFLWGVNQCQLSSENRFSPLQLAT